MKSWAKLVDNSLVDDVGREKLEAVMMWCG